jgi:hypothetical protein
MRRGFIERVVKMGDKGDKVIKWERGSSIFSYNLPFS